MSKDTRNVKLGTLVDETNFPLITLEIGESEETEYSLKDKVAVYKPIYLISVYSQDYANGFDLLNTLIEELKGLATQGMYVLHTRTFESTYDSNKSLYKFKAQFKEIKIN